MLFSKDNRKNSTAYQPLVLIKPRVPQAMDSGAPSLTCLGNEVIAIIADVLQCTSPKTIPSLALVCSNFYRVARYAQHRHLVLDSSRNTRMLEYLEKGGTPEAVRHLEVRDNASGEFISRLCEVIPKMTGLKDVTWSATCVPEQVLQLLQKRPSIRLHTVVTHRNGQYNPDILERLQANENLVSISVNITYTNAEDCRRWARLLKCVLLSCPNLRKLGLDLSLPRSGCMVHSAPLEYCGFGFIAGERLPALEELDLQGYPFGFHVSKDTVMPPTLYMPYSQGYPLKVDEREYWADNFDWSQLTRLATHDVRFALGIMPYLTSLKEFDFAWQHKDMKTFYEQVPSSLESITVPNLETIGVESVLRHGNSLKKLTIHQNESYQPTWRHSTMDAETLIAIRDKCPHIEELSLDISRDGEWPYEILDILAGFGSLRFLKIWFELGIADASKPIKPYVNFAAAENLFKYLQKRATEKKYPLTKLEIASGCPPPLQFGYPSMNAYWPSHNSSSFVCMLSERDDEAERGIFSVSCTKLSQEENEYLRRLEDGRGGLVGPFTMSEAFRVARGGPVSILVWKHEWGCRGSH